MKFRHDINALRALAVTAVVLFRRMGRTTLRPRCRLRDSLYRIIGVERWQYHLWYQIIQSQLHGHPDQVDLNYHEALEKPAASRYGANTPNLLRWFKTYNQNRSYQDQVKPFNFLVAFQSRPQLELSQVEERAVVKKGRRRKHHQAKPVAPFDNEIGKASRNAGSAINVLRNRNHDGTMAIAAQ